MLQKDLDLMVSTLILNIQDFLVNLTPYDVEYNKCGLHAHDSFYFIPWWLGAESLNSNYMCKQSRSPYYCITEGLAQLACVNITLAATEEPLITVLCLKVPFCFTGFDSLLHKH